MFPDFTVMEGLDAAGKGEQARRLVAWLRKVQPRPVIHCREPGGTPVAEDIRNIHCHGQGTHGEHVTQDTRVLLMNASRRQHVEHVIKPALARGDIVVCERFNWSTWVYVEGSSRTLAETLHTTMFGDMVPDCTIYLDIDAQTARERIARRNELDDLEVGLSSRFEEMREAFQGLVAQPLLPAPRHVFQVDGTQDRDTVFENIVQCVAKAK